MDRNLIKARMNLFAVLRNLEDLVVLDPDAAVLTRSWDIAIEFGIWDGPAAHVTFRGGVCRHGEGPHPSPNVRLMFTSPKHLNDMFDGKGTPIPLKGFTRLGFLKNEFPKLTARLEHYLKPENGQMADKDYLRVNTTLSLQTAIFAVRELAMFEATCKTIAAHTPPGALLIEVLPEGPQVHLVFEKDGVRAGKGAVDSPMARMSFRNMDVTNALLSGKLDGFLAVASGDVMLQGQIPMIDNVNLILDRVEQYLR